MNSYWFHTFFSSLYCLKFFKVSILLRPFLHSNKIHLFRIWIGCIRPIFWETPRSAQTCGSLSILYRIGWSRPTVKVHCSCCSCRTCLYFSCAFTSYLSPSPHPLPHPSSLSLWLYTALYQRQDAIFKCVFSGSKWIFFII
jgi:hypothetical protein